MAQAKDFQRRWANIKNVEGFQAHPAFFESLFATALTYFAQFQFKFLEMSMFDASFVFMAVFLIRLGTRGLRYRNSIKKLNK